GKSTLLKLLSGQLEPNSGEIQYASACRLQHVEQHLPERLYALSARQALQETVEADQHWRVDSLLAELELAAQ
ncbi:ATP-binding cassette domain-containing protein, partial [Chromobacterium violaceum]